MQGNAPDEEHVDPHGQCAAEIARLQSPWVIILESSEYRRVLGVSPTLDDAKSTLKICWGTVRGGLEWSETIDPTDDNCWGLQAKEIVNNKPLYWSFTIERFDLNVFKP